MRWDIVAAIVLGYLGAELLWVLEAWSVKRRRRKAKLMADVLDAERRLGAQDDDEPTWGG